jgi:hypothetical protein
VTAVRDSARTRYHEWNKAGTFKAAAVDAIAAVDRIIGPELDDIAVDGSIHMAPCGGDGTGRSPVDRGKLGHKWSLATDANGIPIGWALGGAAVELRAAPTPNGPHHHRPERSDVPRSHVHPRSQTHRPPEQVQPMNPPRARSFRSTSNFAMELVLRSYAVTLVKCDD